MNADPGTRYPHLDLADLIAGAAGQPIGVRAREHLAGCAHCQIEAARWNLVAGGVRGLASAATGPGQAAQSHRTRRRVLPGPWRRALLAVGAAAAALVLLAGIGEATGYVHIRLSGPGTQTALTAVTGCAQLQQADGTLERVNGASLVVAMAGGQSVTVTTTAATSIVMSGPLRSDIADGASVTVRGHSSGGSIEAVIVTVGQPFSAVNPPGFVPVQGRVTGASTAGFTLVTPAGTRIPVTTSGDTLVVIPHASPGQLRAGAAIFALGHPGPDGTLSARAMAAIWQLPSGPHTSVSVRSCSASSVDEALAAISTTPVTGR